MSSPGSKRDSIASKAALARPWLILSGGDFAYKGVMAIYWVLLARVMSLDGLGTIALANAIAMPAFVIVDAGLTQMLVRDYSDSGGMLRSHMRRVRMRILLGLALILPLAAFGYVIGDGHVAAIAVALMSLAYFFDFGGQLMLAPARSSAVMEPDAAVRMIQAFGTVGATLVLLQMDLKTPGWIALASTVAYGLALLPAIRVWRRSSRWSDHPAEESGTPVETTTVTIGTVMMVLFNRADSLIVQGVLGPAALAAYTVAYKLIEVARLIPGALARVVLAHSSTGSSAHVPGSTPESLATEEVLAAEQLQVEESSYDPRDHLRTSVIFSALGTLFIVGLGPLIIGLLFGAEYEQSAGEPIRVMGLSLVPFAVITIGSMYAVGTNQGSLYSRIALESLVVMLVSVTTLSLAFDLTGASVGMLVGSLYASARFWRAMRLKGHDSPTGR